MAPVWEHARVHRECAKRCASGCGRCFVSDTRSQKENEASSRGNADIGKWAAESMRHLQHACGVTICLLMACLFVMPWCLKVFDISLLGGFFDFQFFEGIASTPATHGNAPRVRIHCSDSVRKLPPFRRCLAFSTVGSRPLVASLSLSLLSALSALLSCIRTEHSDPAFELVDVTALLFGLR